MSMSVCLSVCLHNSKTARLNFTKFLCTMRVAVSWCFTDGDVIRYELPVLWMTSFFHITALRYVVCIPQLQWNTTSTAAEIPTRFCSTTKTGSAHCELRTRGEICYPRLACCLVRRSFGRGRDELVGFHQVAHVDGVHGRLARWRADLLHQARLGCHQVVRYSHRQIHRPFHWLQ